jgi:hypothetical protein
MNEDYSEEDLDYSEMSDDELFEIVNSGFGDYNQKVVDGAKNELENRKHDNAQIESNHQVMKGEVPLPILLESTSGSKLFSVEQITLATFLGAPIAGCLLLAQNYRALGKGDAAWQSLVAGIVSTILLFIIVFLLPENFLGMGLAVGSCIGMRQVVKQLQGGAIDNHLKGGGRNGSWAVTTVVGLGCSVIVLGIIFGLIIAFNIQ